MKAFTVAAVYDRRCCTMKHRLLLSAVIDRRYRRIIPCVMALGLAACASAVSSEKMARVHLGMKVAEVEAILGQPAHIDQSETTGLRGQVYDYPAPDGDGRVVFLNDAVFKADFIPGAKKS